MVIYGYARLVGYTPELRDRPRHRGERRRRGRPGLHLPSAPGPQMVGRRALHLGGFPLLLGGHGERRRGLPLRSAEGAARRRREAEGRDPRRDHGPLQLVEAEFLLPAGARRRAAGRDLPAVALPEAVPRQACRAGRRREDGGRRGRAELGGAALQQGPLLPERQPRLPDAAALGAADAAAVRPLPLQAQSLLPPRRLRPASSCPTSTRWRSASRAPTSFPPRSPSGEADLQGAYLGFSNFTFLKEAEERSELRGPPLAGHEGRARGALPRPQRRSTPVCASSSARPISAARCRSAIDRDDINNTIFYGVAAPSNNTVLPESPLFKDEYQTNWAEYDPDMANAASRRPRPDRSATATASACCPTAGRCRSSSRRPARRPSRRTCWSSIRDHWSKVGVSLFIKPSQREVFYNRINAGETQMAVWWGLENAHAHAAR